MGKCIDREILEGEIKRTARLVDFSDMVVRVATQASSQARQDYRDALDDLTAFNRLYGDKA